MPLAGALGGYRHQDLVTACAYALLLTPGTSETAVGAELRIAESYRLDDLNQRGRVWRGVQLKNSVSTGALDLSHLTGDRIKFRLDDVVSKYWAASERPDECRLVVTFSRIGETLAPYVVPSESHGPLVSGFATQRYVLDPALWWPVDGGPIYEGLARVTRDQLVEFCRRFVIEIDCPTQSGDLLRPGPLETVLLEILRERVGVGRFPNAGRDPRDVAKVLVDLARVSRDKWRSRQEVIEQLDLRMDFGRARQDLQLDPDTEVPHDNELAALIAAVERHGRVAVTGQPGAGKSWLLHGLRQRLLARGWIVASHYLFIGPSDIEQNSRISGDVMYGSLIAQLQDADPAVGGDADAPLLSAGQRELEARLASARSQLPARRIAVIVDGLDHVDRVAGRRQPGAAAELMEQISSLELPSGVSIVVGSQPGPHLADFLATAAEHAVGPWPDAMVTRLVDRLGVGASTEGLLSLREREQVTAIICAKAAGNPLVATYLCRTAIGLAAGTICTRDDADVAAYLSGAPQFDGQIETYYRWLLDGLGDEGARMCARAIALMTFPITATELAEIHPLVAGRGDAILDLLSSVLLRDAITGAVRVYHESFQRFIRGEANIPPLLEPVIRWLERWDYFADARAFRGLLTMLSEVGRHREVLAHVGVEFVARAAAHNQPWDAVAANLEVAAESAAELQAWPDLARLLELSRAAHFFYTWRLGGDELTDRFGRTYAALHGPAALASALTDNGRCTFPARSGLVLCLVCEQQGVPAPWELYLQAEERRREQDPIEYGHEPHLVHAWIVGTLKVAGQAAAAGLVQRWITHRDEVGVATQSLVCAFGELYGPAAAEALAAEQATGSDRAWALLGAADAHGDGPEYERLVRAALAEGDYLPSDQLLELHDRLQLDDATITAARGDLGKLTMKISGTPRQASGFLRQWYVEIGLAAAVHNDGDLIRALIFIPDETWYQLWLRFVITIHRTSDDEARLDALRSLTELEENARNSNLHGAFGIIQDSLHFVLHDLADAQWSDAVDILVTISQRTSRDKGDWRSGPIPPNALLELLLTTADTLAKRSKAVEVAQAVLQPDKRSSQTYDYHAEDHMLLAIISEEAGRADLAQEAWQQACQYLTGYGRRKDITILEILEPLPELANADPVNALPLVGLTYPLVTSLRWHTDGRSTAGLINHWADIAAEIDPTGLLSHLAASNLADTPTFGELDHAIPQALAALTAQANSEVLAAGWIGAGMYGHHNPESAIAAAERAPGSNLAIWSTIIGAIADDNPDESTETIRLINDSAQRLGISTTQLAAIEQTADIPTAEPETFDAPQNASVAYLASLVRRWREQYDNAVSASAVADTVSEALLRLHHDHRDVEAHGLLTRIGRDSRTWRPDTLLAELAARLTGSAPALAAAAATLACTRSSDGGMRRGDPDAVNLFLEALSLDRATAYYTLAEEAANAVAEGGPYGQTSHFITMLAYAGNTTDAFDAWHQAYSVISFRMPPTGNDDLSLQLYKSPPFDTETTIAYALAARLNHVLVPERRAAMAGITLFASNPQALGRAVATAAEQAPTSVLIALLQIIELIDTPPYIMTGIARSALSFAATSKFLAVNTLARQLLQRAGLQTPPDSVIETIPAPPIEENHLTEQLLERYEPARLEIIERTWPQAARRIAERLHLALSTPGNKKRQSEALRNIGQTRTPAEDLFWLPFDEYAEEALQAAASEARLDLARQRQLNPNLVQEMLPGLLGSLDLGARLGLSRIPRPRRLRPPHALPETLTTVNPTELTEGPYSGWIIAGHYEHEIVDPPAGERQVTEPQYIVGYSGMCLCHASVATPPVIEDSDIDVWRSAPSSAPMQGLASIGLAALTFGRDPFGRFVALSPHPNIITMASLTPAPVTAGLTMHDQQGQPAVVCRSWRHRPYGENHPGEREHRLSGSILLVRPDVIAEFQARHPDMSLIYTTFAVTPD
ncbi:ATP-binding protein [Micromonospora sp. C31]|uniref:ATP-binding protein n=1 Tax=Micromonospora sp. C31 TaxID=2824876 RepID=UPI001B35F867|nr:ATP-binding protein [Micromonospora sp. C31]MBQ1076801.1 ATP-binding protein [Micromonospora sp. C31]